MDVESLPVSTTAFDATGHVGQKILIRAIFHYGIVNVTSEMQNYVGYMELDAMGMKWKKPISFSLQPSGSKMANETGFFEYTATERGEFPITSDIKIVGESGSYSYHAVSKATLKVNA